MNASVSDGKAIGRLAAGALTVLTGVTMATIANAEAPHQSLPPGISYVVSVEGIHEYRLENGLQVLLFPDPSKATTTVNITYLVGSLHEGYGETGMAHLLEHLLFKGSTKHPNIPDELTSHGARPNGSTWFDRTNYFETFSASDENLDWALDLEADRMLNSFVAKKDLDSEMSVVRNEFEIGENDPQAILEERIYSTAFLWHNYGNSTIGARSDIEQVPIERLQAFYRLWYRPENAVLVVAGKFEVDKTLGLIQTKFGPLQNPDIPMPPVYTQEPAQDGERTVTLRRVGETQVAAVAYHIPAGSHPDFAAFEVMAHILASSPSGRLHKSLVETGRATSVDGRADRFKEPALFVVRSEVPKGKDLESVRAELMTATEGMASTPPTAEEVGRAVNSMLREWEQTQRNTSWAAINLSEWASMGDWRLSFLHRDRLKAVTPADVQQVASVYMKAANRTVGTYIPSEVAERVEVPAVEDIASMVSEYRGGEAMAQGEDFDSSPANIQARLESFELTNGMDIALLPKKTRGETVHLQIDLHFGSLESLQGMAKIGELTAEMLDRGTKTRTRQQIRDELDRLQANFRVFGGATGAFAHVEVTRANLPAALELVTDVLRNPVVDASEFAQMKQETLVGLEEEKTDPFAQAFTRMSRHLQPYDPADVRYAPTPEEAIDAVNAVTEADLKAFHQRFYGADNGQLALVGDFDPAEVKPALEKLLGDWKSSTPYERIVNTYENRPKIVEQIQIPDKESAVLTAGIRVQLNDDHPDYPAFALGNFMVGGGFLNSRLATRIRQQEGISYSVGSRLSVPSRGDDARFGAMAMYAPQNDARLMEAVADEMQKAVSVPFTAQEVAEAKSGWLQQRQMSRSNDGELSGDLTRLLNEGRNLTWTATLEERVSMVSPEEVSAVLKRHIVPGNISIVRAGDFTKSGAQTPGAAGSSSVVP